MTDANILPRLAFLVAERVVNAIDDLVAFRYLAKDSVLLVQIRQVVAGRDEELALVRVWRAAIRHRNETALVEPVLLVNFIIEILGL